jgi:hypothetical protein
MGWQVNKLWRKEWPQFRNEVFVYRAHLKRAWLDIKARAWVDASHSGLNLITEGYRFLGRTLEIFAYTLAHITLWAVIIGVPLCLLV